MLFPVRMQGEEGVPTAERQNDFSRGSIPRNILMLAGPMTAAQLINILYNIVDRMYLGQAQPQARERQVARQPP
ncbi:hypothetical protein NE626_16505, partial [Intestinimonas massiliensis]|nr:hypothetical protein [Intestinimonas massiliensis (ex Afouda et al. 2020)]